MKILHISDTHSLHNRLTNLPKADMIIHSGDVTMYGSEQELLVFLEWFISLDYAHKIFIGGNHDNILYNANIEGLPDNCHYLCNNGVEIEGIKFLGVPLFVGDSLSGNYYNHIANIPSGVDVLITHEPPYGILDYDEGITYGSTELYSHIQTVRPRYHLFGHIHNARGVIKSGYTTFANSAMMGDCRELCGEPFVFEI